MIHSESSYQNVHIKYDSKKKKFLSEELEFDPIIEEAQQIIRDFINVLNMILSESGRSKVCVQVFSAVTFLFFVILALSTKFYYLFICCVLSVMILMVYRYKIVPVQKRKFIYKLKSSHAAAEKDIKSYYRIKNYFQDFSFLDINFNRRFYKIFKLVPLEIYKNQSTFIENTFDSLSLIEVQDPQ